MRKSLLLLILLLCSVAVYGIKPVKEYYFTPKDLELKFQEYKISTEDGYNINSWHIIPASNPANCSIIISYGDSGNMSSGLMMASLLSKKGFDVWLYDYRGFGESADFDMNPNQLYYNEFIYDLSAVIAKVKTVNPKNKICLYGLSMGTIINISYYHEHPDNIDFLIGDALVYSLEDIVINVNEMFNKEVYLPSHHIRLEDIYDEISVPFLLFFASNDYSCNTEHLYILKQKVKKLRVIPYDGGHNEGYMLMRDKYILHIADFLIPSI